MRTHWVVIAFVAAGCGSNSPVDKERVENSEDCWDVPVGECVNRGCTLHSGSRYDEDHECHFEEPAFCYPPELGVTNQVVTAIAPNGECWIFGSGGVYPPGWTEEGGDRTCAYSVITCEPDERCWAFSVQACPSDNCAVTSGALYDDAGACFVDQPAYCGPRRLNCASQFTTALDPDGGCWLMPGICELPEGWRNEDGTRSCPYVTDYEACE